MDVLIKYANKTSRLRNVRESTAADMLAAGRSPSEARDHVVGTPIGGFPGIYHKQYLVKDDDWFWVIQYIDVFRSERMADEAVLALAELEGFLAGRTIAPTPQKPGWRAQAFFEDVVRSLDMSSVPRSEDANLPDNMRRVIVRPSMLENFLRK